MANLSGRIRSSNRLAGGAAPWAAVAGVAAIALALLWIEPPARAQSVNIEKIFWCNKGEPTGEQTEDQCIAARESVLSNCTTCHAFVPIVKAQKSEQEWHSFLQAHRARVDMNDAGYEQIELFLAEHFNPENPVPKLPPALEQLGMPPA
jgi:hypothetical protein